MDGTQTKRKDRDWQQQQKKKKCRRGEERQNMELENQNTTSCLKSNPREQQGRSQELPHQTGHQLRGLAHCTGTGIPKPGTCSLPRHPAGLGRRLPKQPSHALLTGPQSMHTRGLGISPALFRRRSCTGASEELWNRYTSMGAMVGTGMSCRTIRRGMGSTQGLWAGQYRS